MWSVDFVTPIQLAEMRLLPLNVVASKSLWIPLLFNNLVKKAKTTKRTSVTRLGDFWKFLGTKFLAKVAQIFSNNVGLCWKMELFTLNWCGYFLAIFCRNWATFYFNIWSHWRRGPFNKKLHSGNNYFEAVTSQFFAPGDQQCKTFCRYCWCSKQAKKLFALTAAEIFESQSEFGPGGGLWKVRTSVRIPRRILPRFFTFCLL